MACPSQENRPCGQKWKPAGRGKEKAPAHGMGHAGQGGCKMGEKKMQQLFLRSGPGAREPWRSRTGKDALQMWSVEGGPAGEQ